ncbi:MAG: ParA family protein [Prevotellaceae bacterium]|nr:ParA family protein [Prevotellaceae bacterium]
MKNHKIVFANQKGGVGKSTLCMLFANYLAWKKQDVCLIDTDLQKTIMMQRKKDREIYEDMEEPYTVQDFDVQDPELMQQLMESASQTEGFVLFDSPGNVSEDGLVPMFTGADFIICPYEYEEKTLDSTGTFIQVINALRQTTPEMSARLFFVPNRIDVRIGTADELRMWKQTDAIFKQLGSVTPRITARASLKRINTFEITAPQRDAVKAAFDFMIRRMKDD